MEGDGQALDRQFADVLNRTGAGLGDLPGQGQHRIHQFGSGTTPFTTPTRGAGIRNSVPICKRKLKIVLANRNEVSYNRIGIAGISA